MMKSFIIRNLFPIRRFRREGRADPNGPVYHCPSRKLGGCTPVDYVMKFLAIDRPISISDTVEMEKGMKKVLSEFPKVLFSTYKGRVLWSWVCCSSRIDVVRFLIDNYYNDTSIFPLEDTPIDTVGNGLLMAPVSIPNIVYLTNYLDIEELMSYKNKKNGNNFFHYHCTQTMEGGGSLSLSNQTLLWVAEMRRNVAVGFDLPDVNLLNTASRTPLQEAIAKDNAIAAKYMIEEFGAAWFEKCCVMVDGADVATDMTYVEYATYMNSPRCEKLLKEVAIDYLIEPNTTSTDIPPSICCVCFTEDDEGQEWYSLDCHHYLHCRCLMKLCALSTQLVCPECREPLGDVIESKSPPTVYRRATPKQIHEEESLSTINRRERMSRYARATHRRQMEGMRMQQSYHQHFQSYDTTPAQFLPILYVLIG